uniref:FlgO family outer membrane protein n=1 Tax=Marinobacterium profundum TaxID=1714300 RepID=UPI001FDF7CE3|nr:FlgO family outer membrane protein [Marinobacterium profundum]
MSMISHYRKGLLTAGLSILLLGTVGCSTNSVVASTDPVVDLEAVVASAAQKLVSQPGNFVQGKPFIATSFADIDDLSQSSTLGRVLGEQFSSAMTQAGLPMVEVKMREALFIKEGTGELLLSRQLHNIVQAHDAQAVVVGTYAMGGSNVYVTVRLVRTSDNLILAADDFIIPINRDMRSLLPRRR